jgi:hypothetical protein
MPSHAEIEAAKAISRQAIAAALENHHVRLVELHNLGDDGLEDGLVRHVVDTVSQRKVDGVVLALADANVSEFASAGEIFAVLVERRSHYTVRRVKGFLYTIAMVDVNVDIQNSLVEAKKLEDTENNIWLFLC